MARDYIYTDERDLLIKDGDFAVGEADNQHIENILLAEKGEYKHRPLVGIGIRRYLNGPMDYDARRRWKRKIKLQLQYDGFRNIEIDMNNSIQIAAEK